MAELLRCKVCKSRGAETVFLRTSMGSHLWTQHAREAHDAEDSDELLESAGFTTYQEYRDAKAQNRKPKAFPTEKEYRQAVGHNLI